MKRFKINFEYYDGTEDFVIVESDTIESIREKANHEVTKRDGYNPWSEDLTDE